MASFVGISAPGPRQASGGRRTASLAAPASINQTVSRGYRADYSVTSKASHLAEVQIAHRGYTGRDYAHLLAWVYNRIHVSADLIDFGSIVTTQETKVSVWNAFLSPRTLTDLTVDLSAGVTVEGEQPPFVFGPLSDQVYTLFASPEGEPELNANVVWTFGSSSSTVRLIGSRVLFWGFLPNWDQGVNERLEWMTDVLASPLGVEQRRSLRVSPRRSFEVQLIAIPSERSLLDLSCLNWGLRRWAIPMWHDIQLLAQPVEAGSTVLPCMTAGFEFEEGGLLGLRGTGALDYEIATITEVRPDALVVARPLQKDWPMRSRLYPVKSAQFMEQPETARLTNNIGKLRVTFLLVEPTDVPEQKPVIEYRGKPVFTQRPAESQDLTYSYQRLVDIVDNNVSNRRLHDTAGIGFTAQSHQWMLHDRQQRNAMRGLWYYLRGRQRSLWVPTHNDDLILASDVEPGANAINCKMTGYTRFARNQPGRRDILLTLRDGSEIMRRITSATEEGETERLVLDGPLHLDRIIRPRDVERISFMALSRLDQDFIELRHEVDSDGLATANAVFRSLRDDIGSV